MSRLWRRYPARTGFLLLFLILAGVIHAAYGTPWVERVIVPFNETFLMPSLRFLPGLLPFSCFEVLVAGGVLGLLVFLVLLVVGGIRASHRATFFYRRLSAFLCLLAGGYLLFCLTWGAYYHRDVLGSRLGLIARPVSAQQLYDAGVRLTEGLNRAAQQAPRGKNGNFILPGGEKKVLSSAPQVMENSGYAFLRGNFPPPKGMAASELLNYLFIDGIYCPFTGEANLNIAGHGLFFPASTLHEMAHQRGIAREDEANFVAYLVAKDSGDPSFAYAGYCLAFAHLSSALRSADPKKFEELYRLVDPVVLRDFSDYNAFLSRYITPAKDISNAANDAYLKSQGQAEGVKSYGRMVDLLVAELLSGS
jgi:hypothetical protein